MRLRDLKLRHKLLLAGILPPAVLVLGLFAMYALEERQQSIARSVEKARSICLAAESAREEMEAKWKVGLFKQADLRQWAAAGEREKVLGAVPVVTAWKTAMLRSEAGGYTFRTPRAEARNAANRPDALEQRALRALDDGNLDEYYEIDPATDSVRYFRSVKMSTTCLVCHGDPATSVALWGRHDGTDPTGNRMEGWREGERRGAFEVVQGLSAARAETRSSLAWAAGLLVVALGALAVVYVRIAHNLSTPLAGVVTALGRTAHGDLEATERLDRGDEIGELSSSLGAMNEQLRGVVQRLAGSSQALASHSGELSAVAGEMADAARDTSTESGTVSANGHELARSVHNMASTAEELSSSALSVAAAVEEMSATIQEVARHCTRESAIAQRASRQAQSTRAEIAQLAEAAREIDRVVLIVRKIAEQTDLLALNATIEAANSGEAGKGFAVVAGEVKELARRSSAATVEIASRIDTIREGTQAAVAAIEEIAGVIEEVDQTACMIAAAVEEQSATTSEIARTVGGVSEASRTLARDVANCANAAQAVSGSIATVDLRAGQTASGAARCRQGAEELALIADEFKGIVARFRL